MKWMFDRVVAFIALVVLSPVLLLVALVVKWDSKGPILFVQRRIGMNDIEFSMYKFRTMVVGTPNVATDKLNNSQNYITKIGYYLRKYSLDELPQLLNILCGEMSLVGPRPALYNQYDLRAARNEAGISRIRPGLTGWAQINGRDDIALEKKVQLDLYYLQNQSFIFDLQIIRGTIFSITAGNGVSEK